MRKGNGAEPNCKINARDFKISTRACKPPVRKRQPLLRGCEPSVRECKSPVRACQSSKFIGKNAARRCTTLKSYGRDLRITSIKALFLVEIDQTHARIRALPNPSSVTSHFAERSLLGTRPLSCENLPLPILRGGST